MTAPQADGAPAAPVAGAAAAAPFSGSVARSGGGHGLGSEGASRPARASESGGWDPVELAVLWGGPYSGVVLHLRSAQVDAGVRLGSETGETYLYVAHRDERGLLRRNAHGDIILRHPS